MRIPRMLTVWMVVCGVAAVSAAGNVEVTTSAAHDEVFGMVASVDGKNDRAFVQDGHPDAETTYRVSFWFHPGDMAMAAKANHMLFQAVGPNPDSGEGEARILEIELKKNAKNRLKVRAFSYHDDQAKVRKVASKSIRIDDKGWNQLVLEWTAASDNGSPDGFTRLSLTGGSRAGKTVEISGRVADQRHAIDAARMGMIRGVDATTVGSCHFDTFESFRTLSGN